MAGIGLFLVTSSVGRAWCGYTCPQTVWVDLFLVVERAVEGDRNKRIRMDKASWTFDKIPKRTVKHAIWLLSAMSTGGAWIFYFADAPSLAAELFTGNAAGIAYSTVAVWTFTTYTLGGLMREQVCTYMCPWPRIQGAMLDEHSLTVTYNDWRGEPRSRHQKKLDAAGTSTGDCIDCNACVPVCPVEAIYPEDELPEKWAHYAEWNAYLAPRWQALGHNLIEKRPESPPATDLSCAERPRSETDILTWEDDVQDEPGT